LVWNPFLSNHGSLRPAAGWFRNAPEKGHRQQPNKPAAATSKIGGGQAALRPTVQTGPARTKESHLITRVGNQLWPEPPKGSTSRLKV
jgi:hypothetical protein